MYFKTPEINGFPRIRNVVQGLKVGRAFVFVDSLVQYVSKKQLIVRHLNAE